MHVTFSMFFGSKMNLVDGQQQLDDARKKEIEPTMVSIIPKRPPEVIGDSDTEFVPLAGIHLRPPPEWVEEVFKIIIIVLLLGSGVEIGLLIFTKLHFYPVISFFTVPFLIYLIDFQHEAFNKLTDDYFAPIVHYRIETGVSLATIAVISNNLKGVANPSDLLSAIIALIFIFVFFGMLAKIITGWGEKLAMGDASYRQILMGGFICPLFLLMTNITFDPYGVKPTTNITFDLYGAEPTLLFVIPFINMGINLLGVIGLIMVITYFAILIYELRRGGLYFNLYPHIFTLKSRHERLSHAVLWAIALPILIATLYGYCRRIKIEANIVKKALLKFQNRSFSSIDVAKKLHDNPLNVHRALVSATFHSHTKNFGLDRHKLVLFRKTDTEQNTYKFFFVHADDFSSQNKLLMDGYEQVSIEEWWDENVGCKIYSPSKSPLELHVMHALGKDEKYDALPKSLIKELWGLIRILICMGLAVNRTTSERWKNEATEPRPEPTFGQKLKKHQWWIILIATIVSAIAAVITIILTMR